MCHQVLGALIVGITSAAVVSVSHAATTLYRSPLTWADAHPAVRSLPLTAGDILAATEVDSFPTDDTRLPGQRLTFPASATGFEFDFQLHSLTNRPFTFRSSLVEPYGPEGLTAGDVQAQDGSDWEIIFSGGVAVHGFGFNFIDNEGDPDRLMVYGTNNMLLAIFRGPFSKHTFLGVRSDQRIGRVVMDDDPVDVSFFSGLRFGLIPEPTCLTWVAMTALLLARRRQGRR